jgi:hypothetical protein
VDCHGIDERRAADHVVITSQSDAAQLGSSMQSCVHPPVSVSDHFVDVNKMIQLADFAPTIILKAKDFTTEITIHNARANQMRSEPHISREHVTNNAAVRQTLLNRGIRPESLPPVEDVKKVERRLTSDEKKALKNPDTLEGA